MTAKQGKLGRNTRRAIQQATAIRDAADADIAAKIQAAILKARNGYISAEELTATVDAYVAEQHAANKVKAEVTGICSYSGFSGEKVGFANNAFSGNMTSGQKPRTNRDVKPKTLKTVKKGSREARAIRNRINVETPAPIAREKSTYTNCDVTPDAATVARREAIAAILQENKGTKIATGQQVNGEPVTRLFNRRDAVEIYLSRR